MTNDSTIVLACVSGPDENQRLDIRTEVPFWLGTDSECDLRSRDQSLPPKYVCFQIQGQQLTFKLLVGPVPLLDGVPKAAGTLTDGNQLSLGTSVWKLVTTTNAATAANPSVPGQTAATPAGASQDLSEVVVNRVEDLSHRITTAMELEKIEGFNLRRMFSDVFRLRTNEEIETYFMVGGPTTTPQLRDVPAQWPKPWAFSLTFGLALVVYLGLYFAWSSFQNPLFLPGLIVVGSFAIPLAMLVLFFEMNVLRNVSLIEVVKLLLIGGVASLVLSMFGFAVTNLSQWLGAMSAGIVEETGKAAALLLVLRKKKYRWILNGLLLGAAVGTGFAAFESAGYAFVIGLSENVRAMTDNITLRGLLTICGGHILWTAMVAGALWKVCGREDFSLEMLWKPQFARIFALAVGLHMLWNAPLQLPIIQQVAVGFVSWVVVLSMIQSGLRQVREAQAATHVTP